MTTINRTPASKELHNTFFLSLALLNYDILIKGMLLYFYLLFNFYYSKYTLGTKLIYIRNSGWHDAELDHFRD